jgi:hypothetical protein
LQARNPTGESVVVEPHDIAVLAEQREAAVELTGVSRPINAYEPSMAAASWIWHPSEDVERHFHSMFGELLKQVTAEEKSA